MKEVVDYLIKLDFSKVEIKLYLTLLKYGSMTVAQLAKNADINRTAAYTHVQSLFKKGVLIEIKGKKNEISATSPENLKYIVENKISSLKKLQSDLPSIVSVLTSNYSPHQIKKKSQTTYYNGILGLRAVQQEAFQANEFRVYANLRESEKALKLNPDEYDVFEKALKKNKDLKIYEIITDPPEKVVQYNLEGTATETTRYFYRFMPDLFDLSATCVYIYNDKVAIINLKEDINCIVLHNPEYFLLSKRLFDFNWNLLPDPKV